MLLKLPASDALYSRATTYLPGGNTRTQVFVPPRPPYAATGAGCYITDEDGNQVLDLHNNYTALIHGHRHPVVSAAAASAIDNGACFGLPTKHEVELAATLAGRLESCEKWRFMNSGTEAIMVAIRLARAITGRTGLLRFRDCYHGSYDDVVDDTPGVAGARSDVVVAELDERPMNEAIAKHSTHLACVIFDAMPNRAGLLPATRDFVQSLRAATELHDILLIFDEVITFRLSSGGAQAIYDVKPDITVLGKIVGGGFPVGAVGGPGEVMAAFDPRTPSHVVHTGTFVANPVTMRAGLAALELLTEEEIGRINTMGDDLRMRLTSQGWNVTGLGSLLRVHTDRSLELWWYLYERGVLIAPNGLMSVSTAMDESIMTGVLDAFGDTADQFRADPVPRVGIV